jgi:hypothetical protein
MELKKIEKFPFVEQNQFYIAVTSLRCVAAYFFAKGADANEISFG